MPVTKTLMGAMVVVDRCFSGELKIGVKKKGEIFYVVAQTHLLYVSDTQIQANKPPSVIG